jgi:hypothetical protein
VNGPPIPFLGIEVEGAVVTHVYHDSPADLAGLGAEDMLESVNGVAVKDEDALRAVIAQRRAGDSIELIWRDKFGVLFSKQITLGSRSKNQVPNWPRTDMFGRIVPSLEATDHEGRRILLADYRGRAVVIFFWSSACGACERMQAIIYMLRERFPEECLVCISACIDPDESGWRRVVRTRALNGIQIRTADWAQQFHVSGVPLVLFVDKTGKLRYESVSCEDPIAKLAMGLVRE